MTLADSAIVGLVALLVMCVPGLQYLSRIIRRRLHSRRYQVADTNTLLPLSEPFFPTIGRPGDGSVYPQATPVTPITAFGLSPHIMPVDASGNPNFTSMQGFVSNDLAFGLLRVNLLMLIL
jgi:hypothetical protein